MTARVRVTPVILTYNEEVNLQRALSSLKWANRVVVLDSGSTDATKEIAGRFANVAWFQRPFDSFAGQWKHAMRCTGIDTEYALVLDADMWLPELFLNELEQRFLPGRYDAAYIPFEWHFYGRRLNGSVYPAQLRLIKPADVSITQTGHAPQVSTAGLVYRFRARAVHDDRKPLERWTNAQLAYSMLELERLAGQGPLRWRDRLRRIGVMPPLVGLLAYLRAGGPLRGAAAVRYAYERAAYECLLAIRLMDDRLQNGAKEKLAVATEQVPQLELNSSQ